MIQEIINFIDYLENKSPEIFSENLELKEGLYIFLEKEEGELVIKDKNILKVEKKTKPEELEGEDAKLYDEFLQLYSVTEMINNKSLNSSEKIFIDIGSPFAISISGKGVKPDMKKSETFEQKRIKQNNAIQAYFKAADKYFDKENEIHEKWNFEFKNFIQNNLLSFFDNSEEYKEPKDTFLFYFFMKEPSLKDYAKFYNEYLKTKVFLYDLNEKKKETHGISNELYTYNPKKSSLIHQTASFDIKYKVDGFEAMKLYKFFRLQQKNQIIPNPFPLFIDKNELTEEVVKFYNKDKKRGHKQIIEHLRTDKKADIQDYYLIYFNNREDKSRIIDIDFVPVFKHKYDIPIQIDTFFNTKDKTIHFPAIETVFDFERIIVQKIFNNSLVQYSNNKQSYYYRYFDEIDNNPKYITANTFIKIMKYRKAFYDYIYKSKREAITDIMFQDIMVNTVLDDIRHDKDFNKTNTIKEKLNIWFSLYNYFKTNNKKMENMANKTKELFETIKQIAKNESKSEYIENDDLFAFASGQLIRTILNKSQAGERTHALLEPFLQKTNPEQFKLAIARTFDTYKHEFQFYKGNERYEFDKIMSDVMGYNPKNIKMKDHLPFILAGYFAETIFKKEEKKDKDTE